MNTLNTKNELRELVWKNLRNYAFPDSKFHWDFTSYIPDFQGGGQCADKIRNLKIYQESKWIFITPDNCLESMRKYAIEDHKHLVVSTYGIARGFFYYMPDSIPSCDLKYAATLDGMEKCASNISIKDFMTFDPFDLLITGASVISRNGVRFGKGHGYFDLEWAMFHELGKVTSSTKVIAVGHDCQVVNQFIEPDKFDTIVDLIVTPQSIYETEDQLTKPNGIAWDLLTEDQLNNIPSLTELREMKRKL